MIRLTIDVPKSTTDCLIHTRGDVALLLSHIFKQKGLIFNSKFPAQWGFGIIAKPLETKSQFRQLQRIIVGSSSEKIANVLQSICMEDIQLANQRLKLHMNFNQMALYKKSISLQEPSIECRCISPIHVKNFSGETLLEVGQIFNQCINRSMESRFQRPFQLKIIPHVETSIQCVTMAHRVQPDGKLASNKGLLLRFTLEGTEQDINDAYFSGIGSKTARGFGCISVDNQKL